MSEAVAVAPEVSPPLEVFHSDRVADVAGLPAELHRTRGLARGRMREIVPSGPWYTAMASGKGGKFPVPGMVESKAKTLFPAGPSMPTSKSSTRWMSRHAEDDRFDRLTVFDATRLRLPPAWSIQLVAGTRPNRDEWSPDPLAREPVLRSVRIGLMSRVEWTQRTATGNVTRATVRCRFGAGRTRLGRDALRRLWEIDEVPTIHWPPHQSVSRDS